MKNQLMCRKSLYLAILYLMFLMACTEQKKPLFVEGPDAQIKVYFKIGDDQKAYYSVMKNSDTVIQNSELGLVMEKEDFSSGLSLESASTIQTVKDEYELKHGKSIKNTYQANERTFHLSNKNGSKMDIIFRVSNDGFAFRYYFPESSDEAYVINEEISSYNFPSNTKAWLQPMAEAKSGWSETNPSYEEFYHQDISAGTESPTGAGWVYPALFKKDEIWMLITETGLTNDYCGTRLKAKPDGNGMQVGFPQKEEVFPGGALYPTSELPWYSPWRVVTIGSLATITESTLGTDLAEPAIDMDASFVQPGLASWSWAILKDESVNYDTQKEFIDYASEMDWKYCLVDVNWDTTIGYDKIAELSEYAQSKDVGLILWYNSSGDWNSTNYHPKSKLLTHEDRVKEFARIQEMGIKGVKVDFFGGDGQSMIKYYQDIFRDAAEYDLMVNCHGSTIPRGWHRTYPNLVTMESVKGFEFITFEQANADSAATHCTILPFTRNAFDPMDFTPMCLHEIPGIERKTTNGFELALPVLFLSGIQHMAETPEGMATVPEYVKSYLQDIPVQWEETRFLDGYPGKFVVLARRHGSTWHVVGINGQKTPKTLQLDLSFIDHNKGHLIIDGEEEHSFTSQEIEISDEVEISLKPAGGFVLKAGE